MIIVTGGLALAGVIMNRRVRPLKAKADKLLADWTKALQEKLEAAVGNDPGIPPGMYKVTIIKLNLKGAPADFDQGQLEAAGLAKNILPTAYETLADTKLSVTLEAGRNEKNFDLKGKAGTGASEAFPVP